MNILDLERPQATAHEENLRKWMATHERRFAAAASASGELQIDIMDVIGGSWFFEGVTAKAVKRQLDANPNVKTIRVTIDSPGGSVFDGLAIQALLKRHAASVEVEVIGEASSAASVIAMAADKIIMHEGAMMMIHQAAVCSCGFADELRADADLLDKITNSIINLYVARSGKSVDDVTALVKAETWMTAQEAVDMGFADEIAPAKAKSAPAKPAKNARPSSNLSAGVFGRREATEETPAEPVHGSVEAILAGPDRATPEERERIRQDRIAALQALSVDDIPPTPEEAQRILADRAVVRSNQPLVKAARPTPPPLGGFSVAR